MRSFLRSLNGSARRKSGWIRKEMPRAKWMSDKQYRAFERCVAKLKPKKGKRAYPICMAAVKKAGKK
jgi:hypothetical protein